MSKTAAIHPRPNLRYEGIFLAQGHNLIAGLDEAGRGAWAGPVVAAAVILPLERRNLRHLLDGVRDSKLCTPAERDRLYEVIARTAVCFAPGIVSVDEIDLAGIGAAAKMAMVRAVENLSRSPEALLIDWVKLPTVDIPQHCFAKADQLSLSVAAASIVAKVTRDRLMLRLEDDYPGYGFSQHKGYGTPDHQLAIARLGPCRIHRRSFDPIRSQITGDSTCRSPLYMIG
jgi:ribonuclease HII